MVVQIYEIQQIKEYVQQVLSSVEYLIIAEHESSVTFLVRRIEKCSTSM